MWRKYSMGVLRNKVKNGWAQIEVQLNRRADLIPNLVETVKGYASHEKEVFEKAEKIRSEYVLAVKGVVRERSAKTNKIPTGDVEILAEELKILSEAETTPFEILDDTGVNENLRLKYRYLDLRRPSLQKNLITDTNILAVIFGGKT